jgi:hypothetical protein
MDPRARLAQQADLDDAARRVLDQLGTEHVETLAATFADARERQSRQLDEAIDNGLRLVPRLVRPAVTKILFAGTSDSAPKADSTRLPTASARPDAELVKLARDLGVEEHENVARCAPGTGPAGRTPPAHGRGAGGPHRSPPRRTGGRLSA